MPAEDPSFEDMQTTLKRAASALKEEDIEFMLGGSLACWARGGPESTNDLDLFVKPADAERALATLVGIGMRSERPPEDWLLKAWDGQVMVDLIFIPMGISIDDELLTRAEVRNVFSIDMRVMGLEDAFVTKLLSLADHYLDYAPLLLMARAVREQVDWNDVRARTNESPYAKAFFSLLAELGVVGEPRPSSSRPTVRVVPG